MWDAEGERRFSALCGVFQASGQQTAPIRQYEGCKHATLFIFKLNGQQLHRRMGTAQLCPSVLGDESPQPLPLLFRSCRIFNP